MAASVRNGTILPKTCHPCLPNTCLSGCFPSLSSIQFSPVLCTSDRFRVSLSLAFCLLRWRAYVPPLSSNTLALHLSSCVEFRRYRSRCVILCNDIFVLSRTLGPDLGSLWGEVRNSSQHGHWFCWVFIDERKHTPRQHIQRTQISMPNVLLCAFSFARC